MKARKLNFIKNEYQEVEINEAWYCPLLEEVKDKEKINCVNCGKLIKYCDSYSSKQYKGIYEVSFKVCADCHTVERYHEQMCKGNM